jgi:hypothetical protein
MKTRFKLIKADLYHVFVEGNANSVEKARVFFILFIPLMSVIFTTGEVIK